MNFVTNLLLAADFIKPMLYRLTFARAGIVPTSPQYVSESLAAVLSHGFNGVVLSWNIMEAPLRNLESLKK